MKIEEIKNKTISGIFWRLSERLLAQIISFVVSVVLARVLMPEQYGVVALMLVFINIFNSFVINGMGSALIQKKGADKLDFSTMFYAGLVISLILYFLLLFISPFIAKIYKNSSLIILLKVMGIKLPIAAVNSIQQAYVLKKMEYKKFFYSTLIGTIISGILGIATALLGFGVWALVIQYLTNSLIDTLVLFITVKWRPTLQFSFNRFKGLFSYGYKIMLSGVIGTIFDQLKNFIIGIKYTATDLAYYNRGEQIPSLACNNVNATLESVLFSSVSQIQDDKEMVKSSLRKMIGTINYFIMPIMFGLSIVAVPLVRILLTDKWLPCVPFLVVVCIQHCFGVISNIHLQTIKALGRSDIVLKLEVIKKPLFILFIIIGMQFGPLAIVLANCIYGFIALLINANPNRKMLNYSIKEQLGDVLSTFFISLIMVFVCYLISLLHISSGLLLILQVLIGILTYLILSILFRNPYFYSVISYIRYSFIGVFLKKFVVRIFDFRIFKIKKNKIVFDNFNGKGYGCNPKYIAQEIIRQKLDYDMVWLVNDMNYDIPSPIRKVRKGSIRSLYELSTARVWIDNVRNFKGVNKKKGQYYIQTWHGALGMKGIEGYVEEQLSSEYVSEAKNDGKITDLILTNNLNQHDFIRKYFWYDGPILCKGTPRCDIIYETPEDIKEKVYNYFNVDMSKKLALYAPSFRNNSNIDVYKFDYEKCCEILKKKFNDDFVMIIRLHPNVSVDSSKSFEYNEVIKNGTEYPDVQEIISVSTVIITDYSSIGFEGGLVYKPVFIFAKDLDEYIKKERKLIYAFDEIPFSVSKTESILFKNIKDFSNKEYISKCKKYYDSIGIVNNSESSKDVVNIIKREVKMNEESK